MTLNSLFTTTKSEPLKPITIAMSKELVERIDVLCKETGKSRSEVIRTLTVSALEGVENQAR